MNKTLFIILLFIFPGVAYMSQVHNMPEPFSEPIETFIGNLTDKDHVLIVSGPVKTKVINTISLPK